MYNDIGVQFEKEHRYVGERKSVKISLWRTQNIFWNQEVRIDSTFLTVNWTLQSEVVENEHVVL